MFIHFIAINVEFLTLSIFCGNSVSNGHKNVYYKYLFKAAFNLKFLLQSFEF